jgi:hypothetical protein
MRLCAATIKAKARRVSGELSDMISEAKAMVSRNAVERAAAAHVGKAACKERKAAAMAAAAAAGPFWAKRGLARRSASFKAGAQALARALLRRVSGGR